MHKHRPTEETQGGEGSRRSQQSHLCNPRRRCGCIGSATCGESAPDVGEQQRSQKWPDLVGASQAVMKCST